MWHCSTVSPNWAVLCLCLWHNFAWGQGKLIPLRLCATKPLASFMVSTYGLVDTIVAACAAVFKGGMPGRLSIVFGCV